MVAVLRLPQVVDPLGLAVCPDADVVMNALRPLLPVPRRLLALTVEVEQARFGSPRALCPLLMVCAAAGDAVDDEPLLLDLQVLGARSVSVRWCRRSTRPYSMPVRRRIIMFSISRAGEALRSSSCSASSTTS